MIGTLPSRGNNVIAHKTFASCMKMNTEIGPISVVAIQPTGEPTCPFRSLSRLCHASRSRHSTSPFWAAGGGGSPIGHPNASR